MTRIKGTALRGALKFIKTSGFPGGIPGALERLPTPVRQVFDQTILAGEWYPYESYAELLGVIREGHGLDPEPAMEAVGRFAARQDVTGVFKVISVLASVRRILQGASHFWSRYCDTGSFDIVEIEEGFGIGEIRDFPDIAEAHEQVLVGWIEGIGLAAKARDVDVTRTASVHRGDDYTEYTMRWTEA
ncbi:MAG: hypothetical protein R3234_05870 [Thermoanaerobaculia bacterium]|nr:hypothetical protein [Thermoanaerobaculia bacterium]